MIDAHCHLHDDKYADDLDAVVGRARDGGITAMITIGTSVAESEHAVATAQRYDNVYVAVGLHPHVFNDGGIRQEEWRDGIGFGADEVARLGALAEAVEALALLAQDPKVVAIGEIGLDYYAPDRSIGDALRAWQRQGLRAQLALARRLSLPVVIHGRPSQGSMDAYEDLGRLLAAYADVPTVMHCYMGDARVTEQLLRLPQVRFSFAGNVTYTKKPGEGMDPVIAMIPADRLLLETDAPYLAPVPMRGSRNEPAYVAFTAAYVARVRGVTAAALIADCDAVARAFFALP